MADSAAVFNFRTPFQVHVVSPQRTMLSSEVNFTADIFFGIIHAVLGGNKELIWNQVIDFTGQ
ncbi:hypothetical protein SCA6_011207 [Theobroma cacao]